MTHRPQNTFWGTTLEGTAKKERLISINVSHGIPAQNGPDKQVTASIFFGAGEKVAEDSPERQDPWPADNSAS